MSDRWYAMCSAPRDGTVILAIHAELDLSAAYFIRWTGEMWDGPIGFVSDPEPDSAFRGWIPLPIITERSTSETN